MRTQRILFVLTFIVIFLVSPIYFRERGTAGGELAIFDTWKFFGGITFLNETFDALLYGEDANGNVYYNSEIFNLITFNLLIFPSLLFARLLTFLYGKTRNQVGISIYYSKPYLKKLYKQVSISVSIGIIIFFLAKLILSTTSPVDLRPHLWITIPLALLFSYLSLVAQTFNGNIKLTKQQSFLLLVESMIFASGLMGWILLLTHFAWRLIRIQL